MSGTGRWRMDIEAHPDFTRGYDDCAKNSGNRASYAPPAHGPGRDPYAYQVGWDDCIDEHSPRIGEP